MQRIKLVQNTINVIHKLVFFDIKYQLMYLKVALFLVLLKSLKMLLCISF